MTTRGLGIKIGGRGKRRGIERGRDLENRRYAARGTLGEFNMSAFQPLSSTTIRIDFKLWGIVAVDETGDFREQYDANENRIREQILIIMRSADIDDLSEAGLGLIKRKILDKTNHLLSKPFLQSVHFSNFSFVEQ